MQIYCFDLDNTLCITEKKGYHNAIPITDRINIVNDLYDKGYYIKIYTARGTTEFKGNLALVLDKYYSLTKNQINNWGLKYHELILGKPPYDLFVDDKAIYSESFFKPINQKKGVIIGSFDVVHFGYICAFKEAKQQCDHLTVLLHVDASKERPEKLKPIHTVDERKEILSSIKYIDEIITYETEKDLYEILSNFIFHVRIMGDDYKDKDYTGKDLNITEYFINRDHGWSTTKFKTLIHEQFKK